MKAFTVACLFALVAVAVAGKSGYTDRFDNVNLDEILANRRMLIPYVKCVLDQGKCSSEGRELKLHLKEALEDNCAKCTEKQRIGARRVLSHLVKHEPAYWKQLVAKYDPEHKYTRKYEKELNAAKA